jgi:hypothetical protein
VTIPGLRHGSFLLNPLRFITHESSYHSTVYSLATDRSCPCAQLIKHYAIKAYGGVEVLIHVFLSSALVRGEWSASLPGRFTPKERPPGTHWIGGWVGPRTGLDDVGKRKFLPLPDSNSDPSGIQPVASRYTD